MTKDIDIGSELSKIDDYLTSDPLMENLSDNDDLSEIMDLHSDLLSLYSQLTCIMSKILTLSSNSETDIWVFKHFHVCAGDSILTILRYLGGKFENLVSKKLPEKEIFK